MKNICCNRNNNFNIVASHEWITISNYFLFIHYSYSVYGVPFLPPCFSHCCQPNINTSQNKNTGSVSVKRQTTYHHQLFAATLINYKGKRFACTKVIFNWFVCQHIDVDLTENVPTLRWFDGEIPVFFWYGCWGRGRWQQF